MPSSYGIRWRPPPAITASPRSSPATAACRWRRAKSRIATRSLKSFERVEAITLPALKAGVKWGFTTFGQYLDAMRGKLGVNVASLVGHCALRQFVMGEASLERAATPAEIHQMKEVLEGERARRRGRLLHQSEPRPHVRRRHADPEPLRHRRRNHRACLRARRDQPGRRADFPRLARRVGVRCARAWSCSTKSPAAPAGR